MKEQNVCVVTYIGGQGYWNGPVWNDGKSIEAVTADPNKWLKKHNEERWGECACGEPDEEDHINKECSCIEGEDDFSFEWFPIE